MKHAAVLAVPCAAAFVVACGRFLEAPADSGIEAAGATSDATVAPDVPSTADGSPPLTPPKVPRVCPLTKCPSDEPGDDCSDDACNANVEWTVTGDVLANGACLATAGNAVAFASRTRQRGAPRRYVALSFRLVSASVSDRAIAAITADGKLDGERVVVVVRNNEMFLCEREGTAELCTSGAPFPVPGRLHVYGVVTSDDPPRSLFALAADTCATPLLLPVTRPFAAGDITASVGCLDGPPCTLEYADAVLFTGNE